ncbi:VWA domain containing CoxE-like protein [Deinococcus reticulitermitis]|uniref:VWA domain containing CoxE-like protein n=1 Tax=Deinococcus reticulitermitis TaxID=856736 RepID=A0A1H6ZWI3_9DEIO|nr:VWA domain-containing protein [Deinococcus reticulitermitis]SEJ54102.1 VWA domain containing CoxE-like protein [Deinococcus reticulitermitis]
MTQPTPDERLRRWRLLLGGPTRSGELADGTGCALGEHDRRLDAALAALYDSAPFGVPGQAPPKGKKEKAPKSAGLGQSAPAVAAWLGEVRELFPQSTVQIMQADAVEKLGLQTLLLEPELLNQIEPDVHMAGTLLSLKDAMPDHAKALARQVVGRVVSDLQARLAEPLRSAVTGSLNRSQRSRRPRQNEVDWGRTLLKNLRTYDPERRSVIPERLVGYGRARRKLKAVTLCLDQSGSMASSVVYAGIFGAVLASLPSLQTNVVVYDTGVVDLTEHLSDPVDVLFGVQLGGGTDTSPALEYCKGLLHHPEEHTFVLISDLYDSDGPQMIRRLREFAEMGVRVIVLPALDDDGTPSYHAEYAAQIAALGIPVFACTPDHFPDLMAAALQGADLNAWAAARGIVTARAGQS